MRFSCIFINTHLNAHTLYKLLGYCWILDSDSHIGGPCMFHRPEWPLDKPDAMADSVCKIGTCT